MDEEFYNSMTDTQLKKVSYARYAERRKRRIEERDAERLTEEERARRAKIGQANSGRVPWNKGRKHSPETIEKIRARTKQAMAAPEVQKKIEAWLETRVGLETPPDIKKKIATTVRIKIRAKKEEKTPEELEAEREARRERMRQRWQDPDYQARMTERMRQLAERRLAEKEERLRRLAASPEELERIREDNLARRREARRRQKEAKAARLAQLEEEDPGEFARVAAAEAEMLEARRERHNAARRERRAAARAAAGLEPEAARVVRGGSRSGGSGSGSGNGGGFRRPKVEGEAAGTTRRRARRQEAAGEAEAPAQHEANAGMPIISSGRSLRGAKAEAAKRPPGKRKAAAASADASASGGGARARQKAAKASAALVAEVESRLKRLLETRLLVARTQGMIDQLRSQMGAFANNPMMSERAAAALQQAGTRLAAAQQQVLELEASVPAGVSWDPRTGRVLEVRDAAGLARGMHRDGSGDASSSGGGGGVGGSGGSTSTGVGPSAGGGGGGPMAAGGGVNGHSPPAARGTGVNGTSTVAQRTAAAAGAAVNGHSPPAAAASLGAQYLQSLLDTVDGSGGPDQ